MMLLKNIIKIVVWVVCLSVIGSNPVEAQADLDLVVSINDFSTSIESSIKSFMIMSNDQVVINCDEKVSLADHGVLKVKKVLREGKQSWFIQAPSRAGVYSLRLNSKKKKVKLNFIVLVPHEKIKQQRLNGYRIGAYPKNKKIKTTNYDHPKGYIEVTKANGDIFISPHFKLKQFGCKQRGYYPKYIVLDEALLDKLEQLVVTIQRKGYTCSTLEVLSGYRTPYYNRLLGNVAYSAHQYGMAADVYLDENKDGTMDDLNKDGISDYRDAGVLYKLVNQLERISTDGIIKGGLGLYNQTSMHSPFIHIDVRGYSARWGMEPEIKQAKKNKDLIERTFSNRL